MEELKTFLPGKTSNSRRTSSLLQRFVLRSDIIVQYLKYSNEIILGDNWIDVTLDEFAACESNLAANRQTRMLADLALVNCYNKSSMPLYERSRLLLASAKRNLAGKFIRK